MPEKEFLMRTDNLRGLNLQDARDAATSDEDEAARLKARQLRAAIAEATEARDELHHRNTKLNHRIAVMLHKKNQESSPVAGGSAAAEDTTSSAGRRKDSIYANENIKRYFECLRSVHESKVQTLASRSHYDKVALELQARLNEKEANATEIRDAFLEFKRIVARNAKNTRTGKPIAKRMLAQFEAAELCKDQDVEKVRLKYINLRTHLIKVEQLLHRKDQLAEGLHQIDFEQLKIENQALNEKIEERDQELYQLRNKTTSTVQVLSHIKEKLQFVCTGNEMLKRDSQELENTLIANSNLLAHKKKEMDATRQLAARLKSKDGFATSELLIKDFENRKICFKDLERRRAELIDRHTFLLSKIKEMEKTIT